LGIVAANDIAGGRIPKGTELAGGLQYVPPLLTGIEQQKIGSGAPLELRFPFDRLQQIEQIEGEAGGRRIEAVPADQVVVPAAAADRFAKTGYKPFERDSGVIIEPPRFPRSMDRKSATP